MTTNSSSQLCSDSRPGGGERWSREVEGRGLQHLTTLLLSNLLAKNRCLALFHCPVVHSSYLTASMIMYCCCAHKLFSDPSRPPHLSPLARPTYQKPRSQLSNQTPSFFDSTPEQAQTSVCQAADGQVLQAAFGGSRWFSANPESGARAIRRMSAVSLRRAGAANATQNGSIVSARHSIWSSRKSLDYAHVGPQFESGIIVHNPFFCS